MTEFESIEKEINTMETNLKNYIDDLHENQILMNNKYDIRYYKYTNNILYISLPYFLSTYKYQNKILYNFIILNKITKYGIILITDRNSFNYSNNNMYPIEFGFYQYTIRNDYFNNDLFFEELHNIKESTNKSIGDIYESFYVINLLSRKAKIKENDLQYICFFLCHLRDLINTNKKSNINKFFYAQDNSIDINEIINIKSINYENEYVPIFSDDYDQDGNNTKIAYLHAKNQNDFRINPEYSSSEDLIIILEYQYINICSLFNSISFIELSTFLLELENDEYEYIKNLIVSTIDEILKYGKCIIDGWQTYKNSIEECVNEIKNYDTINANNEEKIGRSSKSYYEICFNMFYRSNINPDYITMIVSLSKKILTECIDIIVNYDIEYSPDLVKLLL